MSEITLPQSLIVTACLGYGDGGTTVLRCTDEEGVEHDIVKVQSMFIPSSTFGLAGRLLFDKQLVSLRSETERLILDRLRSADCRSNSDDDQITEVERDQRRANLMKLRDGFVASVASYEYLATAALMEELAAKPGKRKPILNPIIRRFDHKDEKWLSQILEHSLKQSHTFLTEAQFEQLFACLRESVMSKLEVWVLKAGRFPVAFAGLDGTRLEVLFVYPNDFRSGCGAHLVEHARRLKGSLEVDVYEQLFDARKFFEAMKFEVAGRSENDSFGRPFPILHLRDKD